MIEPISDYQTTQRNCQSRWDIFSHNRNIDQYIKNKTILDIGCAQGWFTEKSLECDAKRAIGIDIADYSWKDKSHKGEYHISKAESFDINSEINTIFLMSIDIDISIVDKIFKSENVETIFFEPYLDSENKSKWKEDEWLQRFREFGFTFFKVGISERDRSLYMLRRTNVHMIIRDGKRYAIKKNVDKNEIDFYKKFGNREYVLPYEIENNNQNNNLILPWTESTLSLSDNSASIYINKIGEAINWIHSLNIVHGDLRISNIVIYENKPYLIDFSYWHYGDIKEDDGLEVNGTTGRRGFEYIKNAILSSKVRYLE